MRLAQLWTSRVSVPYLHADHTVEITESYPDFAPLRRARMRDGISEQLVNHRNYVCCGFFAHTPVADNTFSSPARPPGLCLACGVSSTVSTFGHVCLFSPMCPYG